MLLEHCSAVDSLRHFKTTESTCLLSGLLPDGTASRVISLTKHDASGGPSQSALGQNSDRVPSHAERAATGRSCGWRRGAGVLHAPEGHSHDQGAAVVVGDHHDLPSGLGAHNVLLANSCTDACYDRPLCFASHHGSVP